MSIYRRGGGEIYCTMYVQAIEHVVMGTRSTSQTLVCINGNLAWLIVHACHGRRGTFFLSNTDVRYMEKDRGYQTGMCFPPS